MDRSGSINPEVTIVAHDIGPIGGMERQLSELITGLLGRGFTLTVISRTCDLPAHPAMRWVRVPGPSRPFPLAYPWFFLLGSLLVRLRGRGVLHTTGAIVFNRSEICTVHFCHSAVARMPRLSRSSRNAPHYVLNARLSALMSRLAERWYYRAQRVGRLIGVSNGVARDLRAHLSGMGSRIGVIPNGVDTEAFHPPVIGERASGLRALFVGSEWERKGLRVAIEALGGLPGVSLTVVGSGDTEAFAELSRSVGAGDRVEFVGSTDDVPSLYRRADVFVLPTAYETFSLVTYEAAASGLPLLVTKVNGVEDLLRDGVNGWFIDRDPEDVRRRLTELLENPGARRKMGVASRQDSLDFAWSHVVERYAGLYVETTVGVRE